MGQCQTSDICELTLEADSNCYVIPTKIYSVQIVCRHKEPKPVIACLR